MYLLKVVTKSQMTYIFMR